ncbi:hypothetical protein [Phytohabitans suffuscus]|nr:hypothetical protein [Phytohabitans suffuscus]
MPLQVEAVPPADRTVWSSSAPDSSCRRRSPADEATYVVRVRCSAYP